MTGSPNNSNPGQGGQGGQGGGGNNRRRRYRGNKPAGGPQGNNPQGQQANPNQGNPNQGQPQHRPNPNQQGQGQSQGGGGNRSRRPNGRVLTSNQVLVKYDNLLEQHLITRRKYYEYFNRVDERMLYKLEKNFFDSIEHLRSFEARLEPWQREALEKRKTERYRIDATYSENRGWDPLEKPVVEVKPEDIEDPHFKDSQKEAFAEYAEDTEESEGSFEDYLKLKGLN
jgi:hypothetical protein